ncbi:MAG: hypothetical protein HKN44_10150 [Ilumatobacter sp.]|nr:hypothetical protein [Ilumatobacter sp.]
MSKPWIVMIVVLAIVVGVSAGVGGTLLLSDDSDDAAASGDVSCADAEAVVNAAAERVVEINESEGRDAPYYAALIVEQRATVYAMDVAPACFALADRAGAVGLLEGLHTLLDALTAGSSSAAQPPAPDSSSTDD